ncbi:MAG: magnesium/cobalt transporter CorA [Lewinellaceae bacterium]|nr:magnesium/cobalt transporter CorA [Lewinellaceae bacterium]
MSKKYPKHKHKKGLPPGTLVYTGTRTHENFSVLSLWYNPEHYEMEDSYQPGWGKRNDGVLWVDIRNVSNVEQIGKIGTDFNIHPLALEDILNTQQRPKVEDYDKDLFFVLHNLQLDLVNKELHSEQISIYAGAHFVLSFEEDVEDTLMSVRTRAIEGLGRLRKKGPGYLVYAILDTIIDNYFIIVDDLDNAIQDLEHAIHTKGASQENKDEIYKLKRLIYRLNHRLRPLRDALGRFYHFEAEWMDETDKPYIRDLADHVAKLFDSLDIHRDLISGVEALYQAEEANRLNNVMRLLTVISTIFIPLSFIAGLYGMNFDNMPELHWKHGYFYILGGMFSLMVTMLVYFKRKDWI